MKLIFKENDIVELIKEKAKALGNEVEDVRVNGVNGRVEVEVSIHNPHIVPWEKSVYAVADDMLRLCLETRRKNREMGIRQ